MRICLVLGIVSATFAVASSGETTKAPADVLLVNGAIYTVDAARSWASAVAVTGDRISYVGDSATAKTYAGPHTRVIDLNGRMLLPGFQDSHVHPSDAPNPDNALDLHSIIHREQVLERIREFAAAHPGARWILGEGWDEVAFLPTGQPTRAMLDSVVPDRPAYLQNNSGHEGWANTRALEAANITMKTPDPENGRIERDAAGIPTGALQEEAMDLVEKVIPPPTAEERLANLTAALTKLTRLGITAAEDAAVSPEAARAYQTLDRAGRLQTHTTLCQVFKSSEDDDAQIKAFVEQRSALAGKRLRAGCVKIFLDGAYGSHTVALLQPYSDEPRFGRGALFVKQERLNRLVSRLDALGFQVHMHTQGDAAVRGALDAFAEARRLNGFRDNRHTLAHLVLIDDADVSRFRTLGVIANMTPLWSLDDPWETVFAPRLFGAERYSEMYRTRTLIDAGVMLVWGSDWPVTGVSPLDGLETAVTHRYPGGTDLAGHPDRAWKPEERVTLEQAITAYTSAGAYLMHDEHERGSILPGLSADLVVLGRNLFDTPVLEIHKVEVDMTFIAGKVVFERMPVAH
jgi:predicted amidohydrolase YtcJ